MTEKNKSSQTQTAKIQSLSCCTCGKTFLFRTCEQEAFSQRGWTAPKRCPACRKAIRKQQEEESARKEQAKRQKEKETEQAEFQTRLRDWNVVSRDQIRPENDRVLYIIGNGFDLMHGVRSSYYSFRDTLGKQNSLRLALENHLTPEDIWADFEDSLAHFNMKSMYGNFAVDNWLDLLGAYEKDAGAAEFFMAVEEAASPIVTVAEELPLRFRAWVETLAIGTRDRPLQSMFRNGKVLCFNYTEFVETLYNIPEENICYIHGCRKHKKEALILGHIPGASEEAFDFADDYSVGRRKSYRRALVEAAQEHIVPIVSEYDGALTKDCKKIIAAHRAFFSSLGEIEAVIVIGHSLSPVDWDYFSEVASHLSDHKQVRWLFGCYGLRDLNNLEQLLVRLGIARSAVSVFRTDDVSVTPLKEQEEPITAVARPAWKTQCLSSDGRWVVKTADGMLSIIDLAAQEVYYEAMLSFPVSKAFFVLSGKYLFAMIHGIDSGVLLFHFTAGQWNVSELESMPHQPLINSRLNHVFLTETEILFVYNNRVRKYALSDGSLVVNQPLRNAGSFPYEGEEITHLFQMRK